MVMTKGLSVWFWLIVLSFCSASVQASAEDRPPQRIVALAPHAVELLYALGAGDRIIATTEYADYPEAAKNIPRVGGYHGLNIERIYELQPDLVIVWENGNKSDDIERFEELGLPIFRSKTDKLDTLPAHLMRLGKVLGLEAKAQALADSFTRRLADIRAKNANKAPVSFFYQLWLEPLRTMTAQSWVNDVLLACNGRNIFDSTDLSEYPQVNMETVLLRAPQAIIVPSHHGDVLATGEAWLQWPEIPAVRNQHIYYIDGDILHRYALRILEGVETVCEAFDKVRASESKSEPMS